MFRDILSSKLVIAGLTCCVLIVAGSLLYRWHVVSSLRKDEARTQRFLQQLESSDGPRAPQQETTTDAQEEQAAAPVATDDDAASVPDISVPRPNSKAARVDTAKAPEATVANEKTTNVPVSPYGFGPYPELPEGWPSDIWPRSSPEHELMMRVEIKLISQGINVIGSTMGDGLVYPTIQDTVYIEWDEEDGEKYISNLSGDPAACKRINAIEEAKGEHERFTEADIPSDIKVLSFQEGGIDPYQFLELP